MKVGDLIKCGIETAIILETHPYLNTSRPGHPLDDILWLKCLWCTGDISEIESDEVEVISESR